jgi:predicted anti-sigma-YlaC factor YlaD
MRHDEIVCREFVEIATEYLDGALPEADLEVVEEHLVICSSCRAYLGQIEATAAAVGSTAHDTPTEETVRALVGAFAVRTRNGGAR